jgi:DnaJ-class molecular chaperone
MPAELILLMLAGGGCWYGWTGHVRRYKKCRQCQGLGFEPSRRLLRGSAYRPCRRCRGYGQVLRAAARRVDRRCQEAGRRPRRRTYR